MFYLMDAVIAQVVAMHKDAVAFEEALSHFPADAANRLRDNRRKAYEEERQHQRNLEVAREGRSLNFWGFR